MITAVAAMLHDTAQSHEINPNAIDHPRNVLDLDAIRQPNFGIGARTLVSGDESVDGQGMEISRAGERSEWENVILAQRGPGWVINGDGRTADTAKIIGSKDMKPSGEGEIRYALTSDYDLPTMVEARDTFVREMLQLRYNTGTRQDPKWCRPHPYLIGHLAEHLFVEFMGRNALQRVKSIIATAAKESPTGLSLAHAERAETYVRENGANMPVRITAIFAKASAAIQMEAKKDAYFGLKRMVNECMLLEEYNDLVAVCRLNPTGPEASTIESGGLPTGVGRDWGTLAKTYFGRHMGMDAKTFRNMVFRASGYRLLVDRYGAGILLLMNPKNTSG